MSIYSRTGDQGETDLLGGARVPKDAIRLEVCGDLDELNALLGLVQCENPPAEMALLLQQIQRRLFSVGAEVVAIETNQVVHSSIGPQDVEAMEQILDQYESQLKATRTFILPGGCRASALLHLARAVCRRAERRMVSLARTQQHAASESLLSYMNRLGDLLFIMARTANAQAGIGDTTC